MAAEALSPLRDRTDVRGIWIVIPAFNEAPVIADVVTNCRARFPNVVVVDDCSRDDTSRRARAAGASVVRHPINLGQGAALQTGIRYALEHDADYIVTFDADGQHRPEDIEVMLKTLMETGADAVLGSRFLGGARGIPWLRKVVLKAATKFTRATTGLNLTDTHNGLRLLSRNVASKLRIAQNGMAHASEILEQLAAMKVKVVEAPVEIVYTEYSLRKGQKLRNALSIVADLLIARLGK